MSSDDEWIDKQRARVKALQEQLEREETEREAAASERAVRSKSSASRDAVFLVGMSVLAVVLFLSGMTLVRLGGQDFGDATRTGRASVARCWGHGPVTGKGFGYWDTCDVTVRWDDGTVEDLTKDHIFAASDRGEEIRIGDLGRHRTSRELAREDVPYRPWLRWIGVPVMLIGALPGILAVLVIREHLRSLFRFRRR
ncbi:DUF6346 domain-containing protein [Actinoplanes sp. NEAU-A12]|uniref:DUF6346 domain-containing protein n=1 Tax=Actinoplanes sandaracinus TaxID=3045177 RepID=A0ABT6WUV6_9ACTN|nr:DUF6346 domain-containing protein [Actinoplanes sandaracinus]MDI6103474.1 DUF6346 domain-containing protein [Actinoplanes sandaracinus]